MNKSKHYSLLRIRKKNGEYRKLYNPDAVIRGVQCKILAKVLSKCRIDDYVYAFEKKKSIPGMAAKHTGKRLVISIDLKDFFTSITQRYIIKCLMGLGMAEAPAKTTAELCTYKFFVPQGAITSPKVSNLVTTHTFGPKVRELCIREGFDLTIYADDITISTNMEGHIDVPRILSELHSIVRSEGFRVNSQKTKVMWRKARQYVCGVVVNEKTNLLKKNRKNLRAIVHNVCRNGLEAEAAKNELFAGEFESQLKGKLGWFAQLNPTLGTFLKEKLKAYLESVEPESELPPEVSYLSPEAPW